MEQITLDTLNLISEKTNNKKDIEKDYEYIINNLKKLIKQKYINDNINTINEKQQRLKKISPNSKTHAQLLTTYLENIKTINDNLNINSTNLEKTKKNIQILITNINIKHLLRLNEIINIKTNTTELNIALSFLYNKGNIVDKINLQKENKKEIDKLTNEIHSLEETINKINNIIKNLENIKLTKTINIFNRNKNKEIIRNNIRDLEVIKNKLNKEEIINELDKLINNIKEKKQIKNTSIKLNELYKTEINTLNQKKNKLKNNKIDTKDNHYNEKINEYLLNTQNNYITYILNHILTNKENEKNKITVNLILILNLLEHIENYYPLLINRLKELDYELILINTIIDDKHDEKSLENKIDLQNKIIENITKKQEEKTKTK